MRKVSLSKIELHRVKRAHVAKKAQAAKTYKCNSANPMKLLHVKVECFLKQQNSCMLLLFIEYFGASKVGKLVAYSASSPIMHTHLL